MIALKFLRRGAVAPFTGVQWRVGEWVDAVDFPDRGVHALGWEHLAYWLDEELWVVELEAPIVEGPAQLIAARGRLARRVDAWNEGARRALVEDVVARARARIEGARVGWSPPAGAAWEAVRAEARALDTSALDARRRAMVACYASVLGAALTAPAATAAFVGTTLAAIERCGPDPAPEARDAAREAASLERRAQSEFLATLLDVRSIG
ncbi:MAG: hypothetical protein U0414_07955 [Polyangiaceae bacterium]